MRIAAAQARPAWLDPTAGTKIVVDWLARAAEAGAELVAFPETFLSGYPIWLAHTGGARFDDPEQKAAYAYYHDAAVTLDGPQLATIRRAVADLGVFCYLGITERVRGTVYCTLVAIDPVRGVVSAHRKLMPTHEERMVWGIGDGHGLRAHDVGRFRVGGLSCWENWMPQARHALYADGATLHVSTWPGSVRNTRDITRFIALEGRVYSLAVGSVLDFDDVPSDFPLRQALVSLGESAGYDGGSAIAGPDGSWLVEPVAGGERLVLAEIDAAEIARERQNFDPTGHYARPDVFAVTVDRRRRGAVGFVED
ncbi:carbon-nitrogen hydrolase family protein [Nocardia sp. CDC159]|uniref:Carbon-nitrogen hydrolase family protein n=1 Tax=Nocardia pulmonis TaxID=2951408 RepID=A0A9X2IYY4_9NOCA|nr:MULTISPECIES: carbon-nitrogen hydrolase family protein [Nocardia]MCM6775435.1 carbon-nitrogen hydrolase family protein [Nocardia pulmonis]MCM6787831.1 carbon-nitrogen hydrolase family protein [Nocardia sp. CDC159]